jgi:hypothetical protein
VSGHLHPTFRTATDREFKRKLSVCSKAT